MPHDAVEPVGFTFHAGASALGYITDLGQATRLTIERLREVQTLMIETNHDEKLLQNDPHRPWPVKQRITSRHGHLSNAAAAAVIEQLLPGKLARVVLGHLSRDCNSPALAAGTVGPCWKKMRAATMSRCFARRRARSVRVFRSGQTRGGAFQPTFESLLFETAAMPAQQIRLILVADDEVHDPGGIGNPEAVEVFPQLLDFVAPRRRRDSSDARRRARCRSFPARARYRGD